MDSQESCASSSALGVAGGHDKDRTMKTLVDVG